jgi:hypothetical protein
MIGNLIEPGDVEPLLRELAKRLSDAGQTAGIRVVGGAAIALMNPQRRVTQDIDAVISSAGLWDEVVYAMALERGLPPDWINDAVKAKLPFADLDDWHELFQEGSVTVSVAAPGMLLAMKLLANRGRRDTDDIHFLLDCCAIQSLEQVHAIYEWYNHQEVLSEGARLRVQDWLARRHQPDAGPLPQD